MNTDDIFAAIESITVGYIQVIKNSEHREDQVIVMGSVADLLARVVATAHGDKDAVMETILDLTDKLLPVYKKNIAGHIAMKVIDKAKGDQ